MSFHEIGQLTNADLSNLAKDVAQTLYALSDGARVVDELVCYVRNLFRVEVERGVVDVCIERGPRWWVCNIPRILLLPFLPSSSLFQRLGRTKRIIRTASFSHPRKKVKTSA